jgi:hypothetical protein
MSDATALAGLSAQRAVIASHVAQWRRSEEEVERANLLHAVAAAQAEVTALKRAHAGRDDDTSWEDHWSPRDG